MKQVFLWTLLCFFLAVNCSEIRAQAKEKSARPKIIGGCMMASAPLFLPKPEYPSTAKAVNAPGQVIIVLVIDKTGNVVSATVVSGHPLLRAAAVAAARKAKFRPLILAGRPVPVSIKIVYNFT